MQWEDLSLWEHTGGIPSLNYNQSRQLLPCEHILAGLGVRVVRHLPFITSQDALLPEQSNGMINWDGGYMHYNNLLLLGSITDPQSLNQKELLHVLQDACCKPLTLCQQCCGQNRDEGITHIVIVEGNMILALE